MKKYLKTLLVISVIINVIFGAAGFLPKYSYIGSNSEISSFKNFDVGGYVKGVNFNAISNEFYLIFSGKTEYTEEGKEITDYYFLNGLNIDGSISSTGLKKLEIKSINEEKIELFDNMYTFEVYKNGKILGKDKNGEMFELKNFIKI